MKFSRHNKILIAILALAFILRFYHLSQNPPGLYWDEVSNGYNAYSILKTAKDEYGEFLPTIFRSYDDYKPPAYIYALVPLVAIFDLNELAVRFPSAIGGVLSVPLIYFICKKLFNGEKIAQLSAFFFAISPWNLQFSRGGFEANFMLFLTLLALFLFFKSDKQKWLIIPAVICLGIALETYQGARIWIPLIILVTALSYHSKISSFGKKLILPAAILILFALPIILNFSDSVLRGKSVSILSQSGKSVYETFVSGYLSHFSPVFLFSSGDSIGRHLPPGIGELYVFELPLLLIGLFMLTKVRKEEKTFLVGWLLAAPVAASLATPTPHALRAITLLPVLTIIMAIGANTLLKIRGNQLLKIAGATILLLVGLYNFFLYLHIYYIHYPKQNGPDWQEGYRDALGYVAQNYQNYQKVVVSDALGKPYIYTLFYLKFDPAKYQTESQNKEKFERFEFSQESFNNPTGGKTLFVTSPYQSYSNHLLKEVHGSNGDLIFRISDNQ